MTDHLPSIQQACLGVCKGVQPTLLPWLEAPLLHVNGQFPQAWVGGSALNACSFEGRQQGRLLPHNP